MKFDFGQLTPKECVILAFSFSLIMAIIFFPTDNLFKSDMTEFDKVNKLSLSNMVEHLSDTECLEHGSVADKRDIEAVSFADGKWTVWYMDGNIVKNISKENRAVIVYKDARGKSYFVKSKLYIDNRENKDTLKYTASIEDTSIISILELHLTEDDINKIYGNDVPQYDEDTE